MHFPEYNRLCHVAEECASLQYDYYHDRQYNQPYPIPGIPILLFPVDERGLFLIEILDVRQEILASAEPEDRMEFLDHTELTRYAGAARTALCIFDKIRLTLVYQNIHLQIQLNLFQRGSAGQIYFPGTTIHDVPPVNIRFQVDPNWSLLQYYENITFFFKANLKYCLLIDAYKFTYDTNRIAHAKLLSSGDEHPFDEFFLAPRYIQIFRAFLSEEIAKWLRHNHRYWSVTSP